MSPAVRGRDRTESQEVHADQEPNVCERYIPAHTELFGDHKSLEENINVKVHANMVQLTLNINIITDHYFCIV